jgi:DNA-binding transcriptional MerR regulator
MPEFLLAEQLASKLSLEVSELPQFEAQGILKPVSKNGRTYYSSRDFYRLKGILHFMREKGLSLDEAHDRVANWNWFPQAAAATAAQ